MDPALSLRIAAAAPWRQVRAHRAFRRDGPVQSRIDGHRPAGYRWSMRHLSLVALSCTLACGDDGRADSGSASAATQPTSVSQSASDSPAGTTDASASASDSSGDVPTTGSASAAASTSTGVDLTATGSSETGVDPSPGTSTADPSLGTTGFQTSGFEDCEKALQATIRDFRVDHPDFEDYTSDLGMKGLVQVQLGADKKPVYAPPGPTAQTAGPGPYAQWFNNTANVNIPFAIDIPLTEVMPGLFSFESNAFFPIDDQGWGNEGNSNNFHFTTEIHTEFSYKGGEVFTFIGDDDLWLFINGKLAIDLGGVHPQLQGSVDLDAQAAALGIQVGGMYTMDIFHAERHTDKSNFRIDTSIQCFVIPG
jgi:fibro-slime domain-containing protein